MNVFDNEIVVTSTDWAEIAARTTNERIFGVLDACDSPLVQNIVQRNNEDCTCLYNGRIADDFWAIAPHLVSLSAPIARYIADNENDENWGFLIITDADFATVRKHLRKYLQAVLPDGKQVYFRFYDPRVLSTYLESSSAAEIARFMSPFKEICLPISGGRIKRLIKCLSKGDT